MLRRKATSAVNGENLYDLKTYRKHKTREAPPSPDLTKASIRRIKHLDAGEREEEATEAEG
jgi:hypothetical protein